MTIRPTTILITECDTVVSVVVQVQHPNGVSERRATVPFKKRNRKIAATVITIAEMLKDLRDDGTLEAA